MAAMTELQRLGDALALMFVSFQQESEQEAYERMAHAEKLFRKAFPGLIGWAKHEFKDHARRVDAGQSEMPARIPLDKHCPY